MAKLDYKIFYDRKEEILNYLYEHRDCYDKLVFRYMEFLIGTNNIICCDGAIATCLLQLLSKFDAIKEETDFYKVFAKMLEENDLLKGNCCEVGAGIYSRLAEIVNPIIEKDNSRLTIYDPNLSIKRLGNAKLIKSAFTSETDVSKFDTLFGMFPCEATIPLVESAIKENKNLLVALCTCNHSTNEYPRLNGRYWSEDFCSIIKEKYKEEIKLLHWPYEVAQSTPIMLRKKI